MVSARYAASGWTCCGCWSGWENAAAHELMAPATVAGPSAGARVQFTIGVDDLDRVCAELAERGVTLLNGPMNRPWGIRTASFTDPSGHIWEIAGEPSAD